MKRSFSLNLLLIFSCLLFILTYSTQYEQPQRALSSYDQFPFERIIWTYWNSGSTQTPIIVQLCIQNLAIVAQRHNFTFILVNESNVKNYIQNYDQLFVQVRKKSIQHSFTHAADLLRMLIIEQNGGIWVDTTTIFLNGLTEIQNILSQQYQHLVVNRFSKRPDAMFFYYSVGQNRIQEKIPDQNNPSQTILYNQYPDYEIWSIFAKKNSSFISEVRKTYARFTVTQFLQTEQIFVSQDIYINDIDNNRDYLYLNMAVAYTLQKKQLELDQGLELFGQRKYAFQFYNLWGLHSEYGPMLTTREDLLPYDYLFWYSKEDLQEMGFRFRFFMKQFGYIRYVTGKKFNLTLQMFGNNSLTFEQFLATNPDSQICKEMTFVVQNSIMSNLLTNSTVLKTHRIPIITKIQNSQWLDYCNQNNTFFQNIQNKLKPFLETYSLYKSFYYKVHKAKAESILHENEDLSLQEWIEIKFSDNFFLVYEFGYMLIVASILVATYKIVIFTVEKVVNNTTIFYQRNEIRSFDSSRQTQSISSQNKQQKRNHIPFLVFFLLVLNMFMYNAVDVICGRQQPQTILFCVFVTFIVQAYIEKQIQQMKRSTPKSDNSAILCYKLFFMFINYMVAFLCLSQVWRNRFWLNWFAQVLGMIGPCILKLQKFLNDSDRSIRPVSQNYFNSQNSLINNLIAFVKDNPCRSTTLVFLILTIVFPNLRYMAGPSGYYIKFATIIPSIYLVICFLLTLIRCLYKQLWVQVTRLIFLVIISIRLYLTIDQIDTLVQKFPRISFVSMTIVIMSLAYLQMGSRLHNKANKTEVYGKLSLKRIEWIVLVILLWIEFFVGLYWFNHYTMSSSFKDYTLHYIFFALNAIIAALLSISKQNSAQQNQINPIKTIQFETYEQQYEQVNDQ